METSLGCTSLAWLLASLAAYGQSDATAGRAKPNFSGIWKLNVQRSGPVLPRGLEALTLTIEHRDPFIRTAEKRTVAGKMTSNESTEIVDGQERVGHPGAGKTSKQIQRWSGDVLIKHWEMTEGTTTYVSDIRMTLSENERVLTMSEHYREPGMERVRDWIFEKQEAFDFPERLRPKTP